jgi:hypothetical protein
MLQPCVAYLVARLGRNHKAVHPILIGEGIVEILRHVSDVCQIICAKQQHPFISRGVPEL